MTPLVERVKGLLEQMRNDPDKLARRAAAYALHHMGPDMAKELVELAGENERLRSVLSGSRVALAECANIIRPKLPSLADNVIGDATLTRSTKPEGQE